MISKPQIKFIKSLHLKKFRQEHGMFVAEGAKIVHELLQSTLRIDKIYALNTWIHRQKGIEINFELIQEVTEKELEQLSELTTANEVLAIAHIPEQAPSSSGDIMLLGLESIRDPGNLGTIIRTADWYGLSEIICSEDCADAYSHKVVQASMGSIFRIKVQYQDLNEFLDSSPLAKYAATLEGSVSLHEFKDFKKGILLIGNESKGLSAEIVGKCDYRLSIPRFGQAESLNAAVAAGVFLDRFVGM